MSLPVGAFESARKWADWLAANHERSTGIWLRFFKKGSGIESVSHAEALDEALCYGWIDGQLKKRDAKSWLRQFAPRRPRSLWSKRNVENALRLTTSGRMNRRGLEEIEAAKADGRWEKAYDSPRTMRVPDDFLARLSKNAISSLK